MKPEELIAHYEEMIEDHPVFTANDGTQEIIDCIKTLLARAEKAEKVIEEIDKITRQHDFPMPILRRIIEALEAYYKERVVE